jgi:predicted esterase
MERAVFGKGQLEVALNPSAKDKAASPGLHSLLLDKTRDALVYVPPSYTPDQPAPLAVMLHGAGGDAKHGMSLLQPVADAAGMILLAPFSRRGTWDIIAEERFGPDVLFINQALEQVVQQYHIDTRKLALGGFSDGASYALSLGLINGDLFTHILAFSPGFYYAPQPSGRPKVYISHGVHDHILPIEPCSRRLVPKLKKGGYEVLYHEFNGEHVLPDFVQREATDWFLKRAW